jgi:hypothetical protein
MNAALWPEKVYALLLLAYPAEFRRRFGQEMRQVFRARTRGRSAGQSFRDSARFWTELLADWLTSATQERISSMTKFGITVFIGALAFGLFAAYTDFRNDEVQAPVLVVFVGSFVLGLIQPRSAWRWALLIALSLPLAHWIGPAFGIYPRVPATPNNFATLLALIPAFVGAYSAVAVRWMFGAIGRGASN